MKKTILSGLLVIVICMACISCGTLFTKGGSDYRSGLSAYEKQEYVASLQYLSQTLTLNPEFVEAAQLFPKVFSEGTSYYKSQVADNEGNMERQSVDRVFKAYSHLQELHEVAASSGQKGLAIEDFSEKVQEARLLSGDLWFSYAQSLRENQDRESLKQAVVAYETARGRNPAIDNIDSIIKEVIEDATVTIAIVAHGSNVEGLSDKVIEDVSNTFSKNRFVKVLQDQDFTPGKDSMVGPLDIAIMAAMGEGWDYVLEVYADQGFEEINKETPTRIPSESPLFPAITKTLGYQYNTYISYRLFSIKGGITAVVDERVKEVEGPYEYTFTYVKAEGLRELNLEGAGKKNLRFVTSKVDDVTTDSAISTLRWDYESIPIPAEVSNPADQTQWISYFTSRYNDFNTFANNESGRELFYAIEVVHHTPSDTYFILGPSVAEAVKQSNINSAIMNALSYTARTLIKEAKQDGRGYLKAGEIAAAAIKDLL